MHHWGRYKGSIERLSRRQIAWIQEHTHSHSWRNTAAFSGLSLNTPLHFPVFPSLSERQGQGEAQKWTWYQNDSAVCLSLNMHKWISEESKCMRGSIKHFREHSRWKLLLGGAFFLPFLPICSSEDEVSKALGQYVLCEYCATEYYCGSRGGKWNPTQYLELAALVKILHPLRWVLTCSKARTAAFHTVNCTDCWHLTIGFWYIWCGNDSGTHQSCWDRFYRLILLLLSL